MGKLMALALLMMRAFPQLQEMPIMTQSMLMLSQLLLPLLTILSLCKLIIRQMQRSKDLKQQDSHNHQTMIPQHRIRTHMRMFPIQSLILGPLSLSQGIVQQSVAQDGSHSKLSRIGERVYVEDCDDKEMATDDNVWISGELYAFSKGEYEALRR